MRCQIRRRPRQIPRIRRVWLRSRCLAHGDDRRLGRREHLGGLRGRRAHSSLERGHHRQRLLHHQDHLRPRRAPPHQRGQALGKRQGGKTLARVRGQRERGRGNPPPAVPHLRPRRLRGPHHHGRNVRRRARHVAPREAASPLGARHGVGVPRLDVRLPHPGSRPQGHRSGNPGVRGREDRRAARSGLPDRREGGGLAPRVGRHPASPVRTTGPGNDAAGGLFACEDAEPDPRRGFCEFVDLEEGRGRVGKRAHQRQGARDNLVQRSDNLRREQETAVERDY
ncbi:hypothetical protein C8035_v001266 [Colletotrichum spinosum]|uniref:Uncharacterized protein n=1 Tax=Colletotrichum spinosum TaxID=1347390 RepID=A0A4V6QEE0_9PEZI|nr:hypothetical protein C8035_v001266 [Colletotrichum spinosum]